MTNRDIDTAAKIRQLRKEYRSGFELSENSVKSDPHLQFVDWFEMALKADLVEPNAMALATVSQDLKPSVRMVLLKHHSEAGYSFYTNYQSRKGRDIERNNRAAILFFWAPLERQVRIEGIIEKIPREESVRYFSSRPRGSQLGAAASLQSQLLQGRSQIEAMHAKLESEHQHSPIPCPSEWGGYRLRADYYEFWQGRENRLHDRICYTFSEQGWQIGRLSP